MTTPMSLSISPQINAATAANRRPNAAANNGTQSVSDRAHAQATDFEAMFLSSMFQHMFTGIGKEGPFGNGPGVGVWRSFLTNEYAKSLAKSGGVGVADQVYRSLMAHQQQAKRSDAQPSQDIQL